VAVIATFFNTNKFSPEKLYHNGQLFAGQEQIVEFNVPYMGRVNMIYMLKVNGQQFVGKLISVKQ
jgi:hypothetical protein